MSYQREEIIIKQLRFQETGMFQDVYARPMSLNLNDGADEMLRKRVMNGGHGRLTGNAFKGVGSRIIAPSMSVSITDRIYIPDGWNSPRCRWAMEVLVKRQLGHEETIYLQGYTDHLGLSVSGKLDLGMKLYINGFIRVNYGRRDSRFGSEEIPRVVEVASVVSGQILYDRNTETQSVRPSDIFSRIQTDLYSDTFAGKITDGHSTIASPATALFSRRNHSLAGDYLASTLDSYRSALQYKDFGTDSTDILGMAGQQLSADIENMRDNAFIRRVGAQQGVMESVVFTVDDLMEIDKGLADRRCISGTRLDTAARRNLATTENCSRWDDSTSQAQWAVQISSGLSAIMMQWYHTGLSFTATNMVPGNRLTIIQNDALPVADNLPLAFNDSMIDAVENLLFDLSQNNAFDFEVIVDANLYDQTRIEIQLDRDPMELFYVPSFADSVVAPLYTRDHDAVDSLISGFRSVLETHQSEFSGSAIDLTERM